jgi:ComF family protein
VRWEPYLRKIADALLDALAPRVCASCEAPWSGRSAFCDDCGQPELLLDVVQHIDGVPLFAGARYAEPTAAAIHRFKYKDAPELAAPLAKLAVRSIALLGIEAEDMWVPVPLHPQRLAERGYNQAALLAREFARAAGGSVAPRLLVRRRHTEQQAKRGREARSANMVGAFALRRAASAKQNVILVDDVVTTGATLRACITELRGAGYRVLGCVAVAYTDLPSSCTGERLEA